MIGPGCNPAETIKKLHELGNDFVILELEHNLVNKETVLEYIPVCREMGMPILIRPEDKAAFFRPYLDAGVNGLMIPLLRTVKEVVDVIDQSYYPPIGHRGCAIGLNPYLVDFQDVTKSPILALTEYINNNTILLPQIETLESMSNLRRILSLEGIDGVIVGTWDLAFDTGMIDPKATGNDMVNSPIIAEKMKQVVQMCKETGKIAGLGGLMPAECAKWAEQGYQIFLPGFIKDGNVEQVRPILEEARALIK